MPTKKQPLKRPLPKALAQNAARAASQKHAEVVAAGREDMALIREKMLIIGDAFYDVGLALQRLAKPGVAASLDYKGFGDLVVRGLGLSLSGAGTLVEIVTWVSREDALLWGRDKTAALIELAKATPAVDTPSTLMKGVAKLAGKKVDLRKADARTIVELAKDERHAHVADGKPQRGFTSTPEERARGKRLEVELHKTGLHEARVEIVARRGGGAFARIDVPVAKLELLAKAAASAARARAVGTRRSRGV